MENLDMYKAYNEFFSRVYDTIREFNIRHLDKKDLLSMLDMALTTGDKNWFIVISERLNCLDAFGGEMIEL